MRKYILLLLIFIYGFALTGCGADILDREEGYASSSLSRFLTSDQMRTFEAENAVSAEQERYLAFGAFVLTNNRESIRVFALGESGNQADRILRDFWGVDSHETALEQLESLSGAAGQSPVADDIFHRFIKNGHLEPLNPVELFLSDFDLAGLENLYAATVRRAERMTYEFEMFMAELGALEEEREEVFEFFVLMLLADRVNHGLDAYQGAREMLVESFGFTEEELLNIPTLAAWDYGRVAIIARYGVAAGYLEEEEAWEHLRKAANYAADTYSSWREYTAAHILGRAIAFGNSSTDFRDTLNFLLNHPESSFQNINFRDG